MSAVTVPRPPSVSTHVLDTARGRPAEGVAVRLAARPGPGDPWQDLGGARTDADGRCADLPAPPPDTAHVRLDFEVGPYTGPPRDGTAPAFFPEVAVTFAVVAGEHYHVPLLLSPFGYSVYRGS